MKDAFLAHDAQHQIGIDFESLGLLAHLRPVHAWIQQRPKGWGKAADFFWAKTVRKATDQLKRFDRLLALRQECSDKILGSGCARQPQAEATHFLSCRCKHL